MRHWNKLLLIGASFLFVTGALFLLDKPQKEVSTNIQQKYQFKNPYGSSLQFTAGIHYADKDKDSSESRQIKVMIIPHHLLAVNIIASGIKLLKNQTLDNIIILSPDHFNNCDDWICGTDGIFNTAFGDVEVAAEKIAQIKDEISVSHKLFEKEHGINTILPFVANYLPDTKIVPLVLSQKNGWGSHKEEMINTISKILGERDVLVISSDFSHNVTKDQARKQDRQSIEVLKNLSKDRLNNIINDCPTCIAILSGLLDDKYYGFSLIDNKTSFDFSSVDQNVTSYISGYYSQKDYVRITFLGDIMFDRSIRKAAEKNGNEFVFQKISNFLTNNDLVVANLEGPITDNKSININTKRDADNHYVFTFSTSLAQTLSHENIKVVNLGNNHILDFGKSGLLSTQKYLDESGIEYFGAPNGRKSLIKEINDLKIGFISYNHFIGDPKTNKTDIIQEIKKIRPLSDIIVLYAHWGLDYVSMPDENTKNLAHDFVDAGTDIIIGTHPHMIQPSEDYKGKKIYYSLGNFVFDQYFGPNFQTGLGVIAEINIATRKIIFREKKFYMEKNGQTVFADETQ